MRIGIVNDLRLAVEALRRVIAAAPGHEVAWVAMDGAEAVERCARDLPDLVLMDLIMPVMDGVEATRRIMLATPCPILVVTATVSGNAGKAFDAMGHGALDAVATPTLGAGGAVEGGEALLRKIATVERLTRGHGAMPPTTGATPAPEVAPPVLALGASTGGPRALADILGLLPPRFPAAVAVVQHVDAQFAGSLATWLGEQCALPVRLAAEGGALEPGVVLVAATNDHLVLAAERTLHYTREPAGNPYRPSVDVFFTSLARHWPRPGMAALLTGMGRDGGAGLLELRRAGWHTVAQDEASCVVYGMPRAAMELGAAVAALPPAEIGRAAAERMAGPVVRPREGSP